MGNNFPICALLRHLLGKSSCQYRSKSKNSQIINQNKIKIKNLYQKSAPINKSNNLPKHQNKIQHITTIPPIK